MALSTLRPEREALNQAKENYTNSNPRRIKETERRRKPHTHRDRETHSKRTNGRRDREGEH